MKQLVDDASCDYERCAPLNELRPSRYQQRHVISEVFCWHRLKKCKQPWIKMQYESKRLRWRWNYNVYLKGMDILRWNDKQEIKYVSKRLKTNTNP